MANITRNFIAGRMNKVVDQRLLPEGEYVDAMNIRMGSTENAEMGVVENTKGNLSLTTLNIISINSGFIEFLIPITILITCIFNFFYTFPERRPVFKKPTNIKTKSSGLNPKILYEKFDITEGRRGKNPNEYILQLTDTTKLELLNLVIVLYQKQRILFYFKQ